MRNRLYLLFTFFCLAHIVSAQEKSYISNAQPFIDAIASGSKEKIASLVVYPLNRPYPLPPIQNEQEFVSRFKELFDNKLISAIKKSDIKSNWSQVGWRGIMFEHGDLWLNTDGNLIAVNYRTKFATRTIQKLTKQDKKTIHYSLRDYKTPKFLWKTKRFKVRVDELENGKYRYAVWSVNQSQSEQPDLILTNGSWAPDGSGGNSYYTFTNGAYRYECYLMRIGPEDSPPGVLSVYKRNKMIVEEDVVNVVQFKL